MNFIDSVHLFFMIAGPAVLIFGLGYIAGSKQNRTINCQYIREKWPHGKTAGYHELGIILGAIRGRPHEWCAKEAKEEDENA